jgi:hypothetical protein
MSGDDHKTGGRVMGFKIEPRDVPPRVIARRMGVDLADFRASLPNLIARGFPSPDPDTGNFDLVAVDKWCDARHPHLFGGSAQMQARDASTVARDRIDNMRKARKTAA